MVSISTIKDALSYLYRMDLTSGGYCFRGQADSSWELEPSIHRKSLGYKRYQTVIYEGIILSHLHKQNLPLVYSDHHVEILMMCQNYGVPTRLLDWSNDLLTAIYFACEDVEKKDIDASLFICKKSAYGKYKFQNLSDVMDLVFIDTYMVNPRMRAQSGCFMLWGNKPLGKHTTESYTLAEFNASNRELFISQRVENPLIELCIPSKQKSQLLAELNENYGVNEKNIYLDNEFSQNNDKYYYNIKKQCQSFTEYLTEESDQNA